MRCQDCFYWDNSSQLSEVSAEPDTTGACRRFAPRVSTTYGLPPVAVWPYTEDTDWCGDFRARTEQ